MKRMMLFGVALCALVMVGAEPASQPTTRPAESFPALQKRLRDLMDENAALKAQIAAMTTELAAVTEKLQKWEGKPGGRKFDNPKAMRKVVLEQMSLGMAESAVLELLGEPDAKSRDGDAIVWTYRRSAGTEGYSPPRGGGVLTPPPVYTVTIVIASGKVSEITDVDVPSDPIYVPPAIGR